LALVALAQSTPEDDRDISIERLSAALPHLPLPDLQLTPAPSYMIPPPLPTNPSFNASSPWDTAPRQHNPLPSYSTNEVNGSALNGPASGNAEVDVDENADAERERGYWKRLEAVDVTLVTEKEGWFLQKYRVESDVSCIHGES
jgi:sorting nexin-8